LQVNYDMSFKDLYLLYSAHFQDSYHIRFISTEPSRNPLGMQHIF